MTDPTLLDAQWDALYQAQREARLRGEQREPRQTEWEPNPRFKFRKEYERTFEQFCRQENAKLPSYPWIDTSPYGN
jgi:dsRNA-specific ribonuclease